MTTQAPLKSLPIAMAISVALVSQAQAGVKSLSSDEMTETYIKDSTIIVTPAKRQANDDERQKKLATLTISPGEAEKSEAEEQVEFEQIRSDASNQVSNAITFADIEAEQQNLIRQQQISLAPAADASLYLPERPLPDIPGFKEFIESGVLEADYNFTPLLGGTGLELERSGNQLIMGFGNLKGVDTIQMPQAINEGPVQLAPRPGGGFDLIIDIPQNQ